MPVGTLHDDCKQGVIVQIHTLLAIDHPRERQPLRPVNMQGYVHTYHTVIVGAVTCENAAGNEGSTESE